MLGFFFDGNSKAEKPKQTFSLSPEAKKHLGCHSCPLDKDARFLRCPKMPPSGSEAPDIYVLGEAPGEEEDSQGVQFVGKSGQLLRKLVPRDWDWSRVRLNNTIRCHPPKNRDPERIEIESCRGYIEQDIEKYKPKVIVGTGNVPLDWALGATGITKWRGRFVPVKIGSHVCWYAPILHPSAIVRRSTGRRTDEWEQTLEYDLKRVWQFARRCPKPSIVESGYDSGVKPILPGRGALEELRDGLERLSSEARVGNDIETTALRPYAKDATIVCAAVGTSKFALSFPLNHPEGWRTELERREAWRLFLTFMLGSGVNVCHNLKFEQEWYAFYFGRRFLHKVQWHDTMAQAHALDERVGMHSLGMLTRLHFGFDLKAVSGVDAANILAYPLEKCLVYNGMDAKWTHALDAKLAPELDRDPNLHREARRLVRLSPTLVGAQLSGITVDREFAAELRDSFKHQLEEVESALRDAPEVLQYSRYFGAFNPGSPDHVTKLFKDVLQRTEGWSDGGSYSTKEEVLESIPVAEAPSAPLILKYRALSKQLSTYLNPIVDGKIVYPDGKLHTSYNSMVAVTGRLSSDDPNLQNFPKRKYREVRGVVKAPPGHWFVACDYGQIEARVIGMASRDHNLVDHLWTDYDIHKHWGSRFCDLYPQILDFIAEQTGIEDEAKLLKELRQESKNKWVFPQFFGSSYFSCARDLHLPEEVARELSDEFWREFSGVRRWQQKIVERYAVENNVMTLTGRYRRGIVAHNELINTPIQGTASDIVTDAMCELSESAIVAELRDFEPKLNVHDDLSFIVHDRDLESALEHITRIMCRPRFDFINVPLLVEVSIGDRWDKLQELGVYRSDVLFPETKR